MNAVDLLSRALPFLHESAQPYEDDGSNEPLELARDIEAFLEESAAALNQQAGVVELVPKELKKCCMNCAEHGECMPSNLRGCAFDGDEEYDKGWNDCREVMIEALAAMRGTK
jgi:hypothetical protein